MESSLSPVVGDRGNIIFLAEITDNFTDKMGWRDVVRQRDTLFYF